jgi:hypothetical protein
MTYEGIDHEGLERIADVRRRVYAVIQGCEGGAVTCVATELIAKWVIAQPKESRSHCVDKHIELLVKLLRIYDETGDADPLGALDTLIKEEEQTGHGNRKH